MGQHFDDYSGFQPKTTPAHTVYLNLTLIDLCTNKKFWDWNTVINNSAKEFFWSFISRFTVQAGLCARMNDKDFME